jgi:hypothetical protein
MTTATAHRSMILPFKLGDAHTHAGLTVVPLFSREEPRLEYLGLDEALARGLRVREVDESGSVNDLVVENPLDELVLLYEGEELVGAKQNRVVHRSALVGGRSRTSLPVDCVEHGRWAYRTRVFASADRVAYPEQRRLRHAGGGQGEVWANVSAKAARHAARSATDAQEAIYEKRATTLDEYLSALPRLDGQSGVLVGIGGVIACLDYVGRADVFAGLYAKLLRGYALDATERPVPKRLARRAVESFLHGIERAPRRLAPAVSLGSESRFAGPILGIELIAHGEIVCLTAFPS